MKDGQGHLIQADDQVHIIIEDDTGNPVPHHIKRDNEGHLLVEYTPAHSGKISITVKHEDDLVKQSQVNVKPAVDASNCKVYGKGWEAAKEGDKTSFTIEARDKNGKRMVTGGENFKASIKDKTGESVYSHLRDNNDGTYTVTYTPRDEGKIHIQVRHDDQHVKETWLEVKAELVEVVVKGDGWTHAKAGQKASFLIEPRGNSGKTLTHCDDLEVRIEDEYGNKIPCDLTRNEDGSYTVEYVAEKSGEIDIDIRDSEESKARSKVNVKSTSDAKHCKVYGNGLDRAKAMEKASFTIEARDRYGKRMKQGGENFQVEIQDEDGKKVLAEMVDNKDGTYQVTYVPERAGDHVIHVNLDSTKVHTSTARVKPSSSAKHSLVHGDGFVKAVSHRDAIFTIEARDGQGQRIRQGGEDFNVDIKDSHGKDIESDLKDNDDGTYTVTYTAPQAGSVHIQVNLKKDAVDHAVLQVERDAKDVLSVKCHGDGLTHAKTYETNSFQVEAIDGHGNLKEADIKIFDANNKPLNIQVEKKDSHYNVEFHARDAGEYRVEVWVASTLAKSVQVEVEATQRKPLRNNRAVSVMMSSLYTASYNGDLDSVNLQLEIGADINVQNENGWTPLHAASDQGHEHVVRKLVESGCTINILNENGVSPLYLAVARGRRAIAKYLVEKGANVNLSAKGGWTPIHIACFNEFPKLVLFLLDQGASPSVPCAELKNYSPLHILIAVGSNAPLDLIKLLIERDALLNAKSDTGGTPLHLAAFYGNMDVAEILVDAGAPMYAKNSKDRTPAEEASYFGHKEVAEYLASAEGGEVKKFQRVHQNRPSSYRSVIERPPSPETWKERRQKMIKEEAMQRTKSFRDSEVSSRDRPKNLERANTVAFASTPEAVKKRRQQRGES
eukprot:TRINITY_DN2367_c0_g1_i2.p1 TRINITY_DN2367_c0_g1~~TRINITY_DN2367_c0_g1_i2.p1  ORF type:complete len:894 (+),score=334.19 TRINITY_DN2367_c0_g1_i2:3904-6585(+)